MNALPTRVTVVIVSYRSAQLTIDCLRSLQVERGGSLDLRAVVVDNASGDYPAVAAAVKTEGWADWVSVLQAPRNGGFAYGNNLGFSHAVRLHDPQYLHMLNPDTLVRPGAVRHLVDFLEQHPQAGIAGSSFENGDGSDWPIAFRFGTPWSEIEQQFAWGPVTRLLQRWTVARVMEPVEQAIDWCAGASMLVRRSLLDAIGGLDEGFFLYFEETEFCWRARRAGYATWYVPQSRVVHIAGQSTKVTERDAATKALPDYWFASRRRYFELTLGPAGAALTDLLTLSAGALGLLKRHLLRRQHEIVPGYLAGVWRHSLLRPRARAIEPPLIPAP